MAHLSCDRYLKEKKSIYCTFSFLVTAQLLALVHVSCCRRQRCRCHPNLMGVQFWTQLESLVSFVVLSNRHLVSAELKEKLPNCLSYTYGPLLLMLIAGFCHMG